MIQLLTKEQVRIAGRESDDAAIACTKKHWEQLLSATLQELQEVPYLAFSDYCALCLRWNQLHGTKCEECPLAKIEKCSGTGTWGNAKRALELYLKGEIDTDEYHSRIIPMMDLLQQL